MARSRKKIRSLVLMATGAAAAYFGDPEQGASRRAKAKEQLTAKFAKAKGQVGQNQYGGAQDSFTGSGTSAPVASPASAGGTTVSTGASKPADQARSA